MFKKILIYGENWQGTLPRLLHDDLKRRGFFVDIFDFTDIVPGIKVRTFFQKVQRRLFLSFYIKRVRALFINRVADSSPEIVLVSKGLYLDQKTIECIKESGAYIINWNPDDFFNMKNSSADLVKAMSSYNLIVSPRKHLFKKYKDHGAQDLLFLDWYYVPELHHGHDVDLDIEASFVGSWSPSREDFIGKLNKKFKIWGGGWEKSSLRFRAKHDVQKKILTQLEMSEVFSRSRFNLNLLTHENDDLTNLRLFEVPASRGLLLTEKNSTVSEYFLNMEDCLMFSSVEEVNEIFVKDLDFEKICLNGYKKITKGGNSFCSRVDQLVDSFEKVY